MKTVYSVVLSSDVVEKIDRLAYENGTNRSNMINQILADYVSYTTPEKRFREVFREMRSVLEARAIKTAEPSDTMLSMRSALAYKYNPTVKYNVELYRGEGDEIGELRVSMRTQNTGLLLCMTEFYRLWTQIELNYRGAVSAVASDGKYARRLVLSVPVGVREVDLGRVIAAYVDAFDRALKAYFVSLDSRVAAARDVEEIYRGYLASNRVLV
ncbi:MAG: hypothetical protein IJV98_03145 [Clostridia bacterium]|nr:hypothetical protein [Clostridia bacterium]